MGTQYNNYVRKIDLGKKFHYSSFSVKDVCDNIVSFDCRHTIRYILYRNEAGMVSLFWELLKSSVSLSFSLSDSMIIIVIIIASCLST
jgi:hypothetical protein